MNDKSQNIVKATAKALGLTYRQLGEAIGYSESAIAQIASNNKISEPMERAIELLLEVDKLNKEKEDIKILKTALQKLLNI